MTEIATITLGPLLKDRVDLATTTVDCRKLFVVEDETADEGGAKKFKLGHNKSGILDLKPLDPLRCIDESDYEFLPDKIYIRRIMQEMFNEIVHPSDIQNYDIVFGSPGVGKSVLTFLAALCCACFIKKPVLFLRKTKQSTESISVFWITPSSDDGKVSVRFDRKVPRETRLHLLYAKMIELIFQDDVQRGEFSRVKSPRHYLRIISDGPRHLSDDHISASDSVTSCGYKLPNDEAMGENIDFPISVWTLKETIQACRHLFKLKAGEVKEMFDVCGGNIRRIARIISEKKTRQERLLPTKELKDIRLGNLRSYLRTIVKNEGSVEKLKLALESTELSGDERSIDRLRAMVAIPVGTGMYETVQYIGTPFLLRLIRSKISLDETLSGLRYAKNSGIQSLYGWHFELYGHKVFQVTHESQVKANHANQTGYHQNYPRSYPFGIVQGNGTGNASVQQLDGQNLYWIPSTSNFANIDAAIALNKSLYCIQYTVSSSHTFNYSTFCCKFWDLLPSKFRESISHVIVVFVVPSADGKNFTKVVLPKMQEDRVKTRISCADGIIAVYKKARTEERICDEGDDDEGDDESAQDDMMDDDDVEPATTADDDMDDSFSDDDCGEEGFDEEEETCATNHDAPRIHFQWETLDEDFDVTTKAPLSFMSRPSY